jgi:hypothetical protein
MIPVGQPYRPAGTLDARSILITTILGTTVAVLGAALVWLWEWSPIPTLVFLTPLVQGAAIGAVMSFAIGRLGMRNPGLVGVVGFACGLMSVALVHYGHYLHMVSAIAGELRPQIGQDKSIAEADRQSALAALDTNPARFVDPLLAKMTGHSGFLGSLFLRNEQGVMLKSTKVTGFLLWLLWGGEALLAAVAASAIPTLRASQPFCEDCGYWCVTQSDLLSLPAASADSLVQAVVEDNPSRIAALRANPPADQSPGVVNVTLLACPGCDQSFADISHRFVKGKETKVKTLLKQHRVSPAMVAAVRDEPPAAQAGEAPVVDEAE